MLHYAHDLIRNHLAGVIPTADVRWYADQLDPERETQYAIPAIHLEYQPIDQVRKHPQGLIQSDVQLACRVITEYVNDVPDVPGHYALVNTVIDALHERSLHLSQLPAFSALAGTANDITIVSLAHLVSLLPDHQVTNVMQTVAVFRFTLTHRTVQIPVPAEAVPEVSRPVEL